MNNIVGRFQTLGLNEIINWVYCINVLYKLSCKASSLGFISLACKLLSEEDFETINVILQFIDNNIAFRM